MEKFSSGTYVVLKSGGRKMKVRWYVDDTHVEVSWLEGKEIIGIFDEQELEPWIDDSKAKEINVNVT